MTLNEESVDWFAKELAEHVDVAPIAASRQTGPEAAKGYEIFIPVVIDLFKKIQECRRLKNKLEAKAAIVAERDVGAMRCPPRLAGVYRQHGFFKERHKMWTASVAVAAKRKNAAKVSALMTIEG